MPSRTRTHVVSDMAVSAVMSVVHACGFAAEVVHNDYGEDLFVQTKLGAAVDPHRIWIQVKGTEDRSRLTTKTNGLHLKISEAHAFRWIRSPELVVVVLWDVSTNQGWWSLPARSICEWDLRTQQKSFVRLPFDRKSVFDQCSMERLAWFGRIEHYHSLIVRAEAANAEAAVMGCARTNLLPLICFDFLRLIDVMQDEQISADFLQGYRDCRRKGLPNWDEQKDGPIGKAILALLLLRRVDEICTGGLPASVMENCAQILLDLFQDWIDTETGAFKVGDKGTHS